MTTDPETPVLTIPDAVSSGSGAPATAAVLVVGNEILSGRTKDANLPHIADRLAGIGIPVREARVVPDVEAAVVDAVNALRERHTYVFTTGGIGPTHDDITSACVAKAFGVALERNADAVGRLERHYAAGMLNEARLRMADIPAGATLIDNPISAAPGFRLGNVFVLAGVPTIMQAMLDGVLPQLRHGAPIQAITVSCELAEGTIAADLSALQARYPDIDIGSYPYFRPGQFGVSLVLRGTEARSLEAATDELAGIILSLGGAPTVTRSGRG